MSDLERVMRRAESENESDYESATDSSEFESESANEYEDEDDRPDQDLHSESDVEEDSEQEDSDAEQEEYDHYEDYDDYEDYSSAEECEVLDIDETFQEIRECENCFRLIIVDAELDSVEEDEDGERGMGWEYNVSWNLYGECPTCGLVVEDDIYENIYMCGTLALNAEDREPTVQLETCTFRLDSFGFAAQQPRLSCMNANKGDCIVMRLGGTLVLYDTGYKNCKARILMEIARPENADATHCLVIVSHNDRDHSGGYVPLLEDVQNMFENAHIVYEHAQDNDGFLCHSDAPMYHNQVHFTMNNIRVTCYLASPNIVNSNDRSVVAVIEHGPWISVLTGDQSLPRVMNLLNAHHAGLPIHTFQIPHHGSLHNYGDQPLPQARNYLVSGSPRHDNQLVNPYNLNCQITAVERAAAACGNWPFNICFTKPYLDQIDIAQLSPNATLVVPNIETQAIRINL